MTTPLPATETIDERHRGLDTWGDIPILAALLDGQKRAIVAVEKALPQLSAAADRAAQCLSAGGRLVYVAAGSPALMSLADALELPQTFGLTTQQVVLVLADGRDIATRLDGAREDSAEAGRDDVLALGIGPADFVIGISASGSTRFTVAGIEAARAAGAVTVGVAGNADAPLLRAAEIAVLLETGPEVISGSTRLGAGTAQKAALNLFSTLLGVRLGHVHDGLMVNVVANNDKLRLRARRIISAVAQVDDATAAEALAQAGGAVKPAILIAAGVADQATAEDMLRAAGGRLRPILGQIRGGRPD